MYRETQKYAQVIRSMPPSAWSEMRRAMTHLAGIKAKSLRQGVTRKDEIEHQEDLASYMTSRGNNRASRGTAEGWSDDTASTA